MAIWLDGEDLPQLARYFYRQSLEERGHALMMVQYKLDRGHKVEIPAVRSAENDFKGCSGNRGSFPGAERKGSHRSDRGSFLRSTQQETMLWVSSSSSGS